MAKTRPMDIWEIFDPKKELPASKLSEFLRASDMSVPRERIFTCRLLSDLKLAAAVAGYHLQHYEPDVDRDGHDVMLEDDDRITSQQLKVVYGKTRTWEIRKRLIRPDARYGAPLGFQALTAPGGIVSEEEGIQGGVILIQPVVSKTGALDGVVYRYTDLFVLLAIKFHLIQKNKPSQLAAERSLTELRNGLGRHKIKLNRSGFVEAKSAESLLALMGLNSRYSSSWRLNLVRYVSTELDKRLIDEETKAQQQCIGKEIREDLAQITKLK